jgi:regulatory protein
MREVTKLRLVSKRKQIIEISLDGEAWETVDAEVIVRLGIRTGQRLADGKLEEILRDNAFVMARRKAVNYCAGKVRSEREVVSKLREAKFDNEIIGRVVANLLEMTMIDDRRVAKHGVRRGKRLHVGPNKLRADLSAKGVDHETVEKELAELRDPEWQAREAAELARKRLDRLNGKPVDEQRRKIGDYLLRRGFDGEIVIGVFNYLL